MIDADEAHRLGLVTWVTAADEVDDFVDELVGRLAAGPPVALAQTKELLNQGTGRSLADALTAEGRAQTRNFATDAPEAFRAFRDKVDPVSPASGGRTAASRPHTGSRAAPGHRRRSGRSSPRRRASARPTKTRPAHLSDDGRDAEGRP